MANIDFELKLRTGELFVEYNSPQGRKTFCEKGEITGDHKTFLIETRLILDSPNLSATEKKGLISFVTRESCRRGYPQIVFLGH